MVTPKDIAKQEARRLTFVARDVRQRAESIPWGMAEPDELKRQAEITFKGGEI